MTMDQLVQQARENPALGDQPLVDHLSGAINDSQISVAVDNPSRWSPGDVAELQSGEQCFVTAVGETNLTVKRGHNGTTPSSQPNGSPIIKGFRFSRVQIERAIEETIAADLWPWVWTKDSVEIEIDLTPGGHKRWYEMPAEAMDLISVFQLYGESADPDPGKVFQYGAKGSGKPVTFEKNLPAPITETGKAVGFQQGFRVTWTPIHVTYRAMVTTDNVPEDPQYAAVITLGAIYRLMTGRGAARTGKDPNVHSSERSESKTRSAAWIRQQFMDERRMLFYRLKIEAGPMGTWRR